MATPLNLAGAQFKIRPATREDVPAIVDVYFHSFNAPFWQYITPDISANRKWLHEGWLMSLDNPTDRNFVVEDTEKGDKIVAFSRWMVPQDDGNQERKGPEPLKDEWDMEVMGAFFGGMADNRREMMGKRPHWFIELLGVHEDYHGSGIGAKLLKWGTDQADQQNLETYLDGSEDGQPYYKKRHGFTIARDIEIPDRPAYGKYDYKSLVRPSQSAKP